MKPTRITIHHTATESGPGDGVVEQIRRYHTEERGWPDIAYHVLIAEDGAVYFGRPFHQVPDSHSDFDFTGHLFVALLGNFEEDWPSAIQEDELYAVVGLLARAYNIPAENIKGHRDYAGTLCPGRYLCELLPKLRASITGESE